MFPIIHRYQILTLRESWHLATVIKDASYSCDSLFGNEIKGCRQANHSALKCSFMEVISSWSVSLIWRRLCARFAAVMRKEPVVNNRLHLSIENLLCKVLNFLTLILSGIQKLTDFSSFYSVNIHSISWVRNGRFQLFIYNGGEVVK